MIIQIEKFYNKVYREFYQQNPFQVFINLTSLLSQSQNHPIVRL